MKILNFGSLNIDDVYSMDHFVRPGETQTSLAYRQYCGGKGLNQSIALARAGAEVFHAGKIGKDGLMLKEKLDQAGVNTENVIVSDDPTGRAIIQVNREAENSIILNSGANRTITEKEVKDILEGFGSGDILLIQNEINMLETIILTAAAKGMTIAFNPAPMDGIIKTLPLDKTGIFILNEIEGEALTGMKDPDQILDRMQQDYPDAKIVLTLGKKGSVYAWNDRRIQVAARVVEAVDTTAAGDTFTGYLLTGISEDMDIREALELATLASSVTVTRPGASDSIPFRKELA